MNRLLVLAVLATTLCLPGLSSAQQSPDASGAGGDAGMSAEQKALVEKLRALHWVKGPSSVPAPGNSTLAIPEGFVFLAPADTTQFMELNQNISNGRTVMVGPQNLAWTAYLDFEDTGYVKDDEKIDPAALLKQIKENTEESNKARLERGWRAMHIVDWASPPEYNRQTKRLEWATIYQSDTQRGVNFFTKVLGRRGTTSIVMVADPADLTAAESALNTVLNGYAFNSGDSYAEWKQGDKVAEYGLAALVLGGAAAVATKKGFWAILAGFITAGWKLLVAAVVAAGAALRRLINRQPKS